MLCLELSFTPLKNGLDNYPIKFPRLLKRKDIGKFHVSSLCIPVPVWNF